MAISSSSVINNSVLFIRNLISANVTDPITSSRASDSSFVMTSYPNKPVQYPLITVKCLNHTASRLGENTESMMFHLTLEVRIWARNQKEKDTLTDSVEYKLSTKQQDADGTILEGLHDFAVVSGTNVDEPGEGGIRSMILNCTYDVYT